MATRMVAMHGTHVGTHVQFTCVICDWICKNGQATVIHLCYNVATPDTQYK